MSDTVIDNKAHFRTVISTPTGNEELPYIVRTNLQIIGGVETLLLSIKNTSDKHLIKYATISILTTTGTKPLQIKVLRNGVTGGTYGPYGLYDNGEKTSIADISIDATITNGDYTIVPGLVRNTNQTGGIVLDGQDNIRLSLIGLDVKLVAKPGETLALTCLSEQALEASFDLRWSEDLI